MYISSRHILLFICMQLVQFVCAQSTPKIRQLEKERNELHQRIKASWTIWLL